MFSQRKSFFRRKGFYILLAAILAFGYFVNQEITHIGEDVTANAQTESEADTSEQSERSSDAGAGENTSDTISPSGLESAAGSGGYYLIKEHNGVIKVFYYDSSGNESVLRDTNIAFSLIAEEDQQLFRDGIVINTDDELQNLLENFES